MQFAALKLDGRSRRGRCPEKAASALGSELYSAAIRLDRRDCATRQRLIEIGDDVVDMLDADAEPDHFRPHAGLALLLGRHLPMRGRGRMAGERLGVAHIDQPLEQLERVVEALAGVKPAGDAEGQQRTGAAAEIFVRQRVIGIVGETRHN